MFGVPPSCTMRCDEIVQLVAQYADDLRGQGIVENLHNGRRIATIRRCDGAFLDVLASAGTQRLDVGEKRFPCHVSSSGRWDSWRLDSAGKALRSSASGGK